MPTDPSLRRHLPGPSAGTTLCGDPGPAASPGEEDCIRCASRRAGQEAGEALSGALGRAIRDAAERLRAHAPGSAARRLVEALDAEEPGWDLGMSGGVPGAAAALRADLGIPDPAPTGGRPSRIARGED